jgi:hypothetical protein
MGVRKGTKVHPASFDIVLNLKDEVGFTYDQISDILGVTPSRVQQIVLHQRKVREHANSGTSNNENTQERTVTP